MREATGADGEEPPVSPEEPNAEDDGRHERVDEHAAEAERAADTAPERDGTRARRAEEASEGAGDEAGRAFRDAAAAAVAAGTRVDDDGSSCAEHGAEHGSDGCAEAPLVPDCFAGFSVHAASVGEHSRKPIGPVFRFVRTATFSVGQPETLYTFSLPSRTG